MQVVLDTNILFSALIRDSKTRKLILEYEGIFLFPEYIFEEAKKHKDEIFRKSRMSADEFNELLALILRKVNIVPSEVLEPHRQEAYLIVKDIDINDALFVACALAYKGSIIWSNDADLKKQSRIRVINTMEAMKLL
ncbi:putative toxin-antitoxin system toxin component, PIN family [Candidatus Woesearchaeota archaeon]|nr:putative toxin-antitoxin system toxin component, PIN family [Candidatus Woesearchaeota archaeon]